MNCRNLETTITELARGQMLEARAKEEALGHLDACKRCASRFADEQTLSAGLRAAAAKSATLEAPQRVESALLSAFRQGAPATYVQSRAHAQTLATPWLPWSIAAAAVLLVFSIFGLPRLLPASSDNGLAQQNARDKKEATASSPSSVAQESEQNQHEIQPDGVGENPENYSTFGSPMPRPANRRRALMQVAGLRSRSSQRVNRFASAPLESSDEIRTEFLPLSYGGNLSQLDDGQVIRVELPRSALQSFGLPVNAERAGERVKADVLLGHDGVARAIRFVR